MKIGFIKVELAEAEEEERDLDADRPVKFVPDGFNSWRIVWAEEQIREKL